MHAEIYWTNNDLIVRLPKRCRELESSLKYTKKELVLCMQKFIGQITI